MIQVIVELMLGVTVGVCCALNNMHVWDSVPFELVLIALFNKT